MLEFKNEELVDKKMAELMKDQIFDKKKSDEIISLIEQDVEETLGKLRK